MESVLLQALGSGEAPSSVFGGEHLLRLFVRLPQLLPMATLPPTAAEVLEAHLKQFIAWMASHQKELFLPYAGYRFAPCMLPVFFKRSKCSSCSSRPMLTNLHRL